ncbi:MAG: hypothetical protein EAX90_14815 [Candidatus Heimdallarchaeota archaeon]|nr:hypothetical protein [Candidatus Heimdallarchaeota archaeon]
MKKNRIISFTLFFLIIISLSSITFTFAGWKNDTIGDADAPMVDITKLEVTEDLLKITLNGQINLSEVPGIAITYNIWVDTSAGAYDPDTETWDPDHTLYEYVAHFDYFKSGGVWYNHSYIWAFRYYLDSSAGTKHEGQWWWDKAQNKWVDSDPQQQIAIVSGNTISFDITNAIFREEPLGTGVVVQGVANSGFGIVDDIAPNTGAGWVDEFDNLCGDGPGTGTTSNSLPNISFIFSFVFLGFIITGLKITRKKN